MADDIAFGEHDTPAPATGPVLAALAVVVIVFFIAIVARVVVRIDEFIVVDFIEHTLAFNMGDYAPAF
jgi:hypothetical protein